MTSGSGGSFGSTVGGAGPRIAATLHAGAWELHADSRWISYALSPVEATFPDGSRRTTDGGSSLYVRAGAGRRWSAGARASLETGLGVFYENRATRDLAGLGFLPAWNRLGADLRVSTRVAVGPVELTGAAGVSPFGLWVEPRNDSGRSPVADPAFSFHAGASWERGTWVVSGGYRGELLGARFSGESAVPVIPSIRDAHVRETIHGLTVSAGRRF